MTAVPAASWRSRGVAPYLLHLRPAEWPIMLGHALVGWWLATGVGLPDRSAWLGLGAWVVLLNGGTLALNSAFDRDDGDIAFLANPPGPPRYLAPYAFTLMLLGLALVRGFPVTFRVLYALCVTMSLLYSVPPFRLKAVAGMDWVINMLGFGTLTAYAGWALSGRPLAGPVSPVIWAFTPLFAALYPLTQIYQMDEDLVRGDRTLAIRLGVRRSLTVAILCAAVAFGMFAMAGWRTGWGWHDLPRWSALGIAAAAWVVVLGPWYAEARHWSSREHQRAMYHALIAWALTDVAVLLAWMR